MSRIISESETLTVNPSSYEGNTFSSSYYQSLDNGFGGASDSNYARFTMRNTSYEIYYVFDALDIPSGATIDSVSCRAKCYVSNGSYYPSLQLYAGTTAKGSATNVTSTSTSNVVTLSVGSWSFSEITGEVKILLKCVNTTTRNSRYAYFYGADLTVTYTYEGVAYEVTASSTSSSASVSPASQELLAGEEAVVNIEATSLDGLVVTDNGTDVTSSVVSGAGDSLAQTANDQTNSGIQSGSSYAEYAVGYTAEDPHTTTSNMYASSGSTGYADYTFDFSEIPAGASITNVEVRCYGHRESSTTDSTHVANVQLMSGSTAKGEDYDLTSTSNYLFTIPTPGTWTREELQGAILRFSVGYYGGCLCGITWEVTYEVAGYTYTITSISADHVIIVADAVTQKAYVKVNGQWVACSKVWKKVNGSWVEQSDLTQVFESGKVYVLKNS